MKEGDTVYPIQDIKVDFHEVKLVLSKNSKGTITQIYKYGGIEITFLLADCIEYIYQLNKDTFDDEFEIFLNEKVSKRIKLRG